MGAVTGIPDLDGTFVVIARHFDLDLLVYYFTMLSGMKDNKANESINFTEKLNI